ncbi:hypothetical protein N9D95_01575 [Flavobacteriales bacterium]|nr:hypothetical protein [Flavobacteriales bacterium]
MKKRLIGTLLGFFALFGFGAIYYGILTADTAAAMAAEYSGSMLEAPNMAYILFGNVMMAYLLVYAFDKMGVNDAKAGAYQGAMIFAIVWAFVQAFMLAQFKMFDIQFALTEWVVGIVHGILGGAAIGAYNAKQA